MFPLYRNQSVPGFYMIGTLVVKGLTLFTIKLSKNVRIVGAASRNVDSWKSSARKKYKRKSKILK